MDPSTLNTGSIPVPRVVELLQNASRELRALDVGQSIDRVHLRHLTPMRFAAEYVARNKPVVITGALDSWPASSLWDGTYLANHPAGQTVVTVDVTPNGRGDALTTVADPDTGHLGRWFVTPHERRMRFRDFLTLIRETRARERRQGASTAPREVPYLQHQNSNLTEELGVLMHDIAPGLPWAEQVFGGPPEATNIWIGDDRSATSFHKDHYENLYAVLRGTKVFTLLPPGDLYRMYLTRCPAAVYMRAREVPPGAVWREVSTAPGGTPAVVNNSGRRSLKSGAEEEGASAAVEECTERLVAVLQDPGYEVLWSAVDTTVNDPSIRKSQPLFYGADRSPAPPPAPPPTASATAAAMADLGLVDKHCAADSGDDDDDSNSDGDGSADLWDAVGGAPLVVEVGPGDLFYLPSLWYHQVEQRTGVGAKEMGLGVTAAAGQAAAAGARCKGRQGATARVGLAEFDGVQADGVEADDDGGKDDDDDLVIAVNFWYDMKYDSRYSSFKFVESLATAAGLAEAPPLLETDV